MAPWGISLKTFTHSEKESSNLTLCSLSVRNDSIHLIILLSILYHFILFIIDLWRTIKCFSQICIHYVYLSSIFKVICPFIHYSQQLGNCWSSLYESVLRRGGTYLTLVGRNFPSQPSFPPHPPLFTFPPLSPPFSPPLPSPLPFPSPSLPSPRTGVRGYYSGNFLEFYFAVGEF